MSQCQCAGIENTFDRELAEDQLDHVRTKGPEKTTRLLLDALRARGVEGRSLLDIGGGVGTIQHELLAAGVTEVTSVDASSAYIAVSRGEAKRLGHARRVRYFHGDFVDLAGTIAPADIVTLDRVICCYDDMRALVTASTARAARLYGLVYPRAAWWARLAIALLNVSMWVRRNPFRVFSHAVASVDSAIREQGLAPVYHRTSGMWHVAVYAREEEDRAGA